MKLCYVNGKFVQPSEALLPVSDLMIQRGIGVFETISTYKKRPLMLTPHLERLLASARDSYMHPKLGIDEMRDVIRSGIAQLAAQSDEDLHIKVYLSGGDFFDRVRGFTNPRFFVTYEQLKLPNKECYEKGVGLEPIDEGRDNPSTKSTDYRKTYALSANDEYSEILYCPNGEITESAHSSFFLCRNKTLITAPLTRVLKGTTRQAVIELAKRMGLAVEERCPLLSELPCAEEAFITGSVKKILPVVRIGTQSIGDGHPGSTTKRLLALYLEHITEWLE